MPDRVGDIGVRTSRGWSFDRESLQAVIGAHLLLDRVPMTLGGDSLTLEDLESIDRSFTFDNMARRLTRERLLSLLINLRNFVQQRELDLWQPNGEPNSWLRLIVEDGEVEESGLLDGWGRPMMIRRAPASRDRFAFLAPLPEGFELLSAGPDGRFGTNDDLYDSFARVLPSGSA